MQGICSDRPGFSQKEAIGSDMHAVRPLTHGIEQVCVARIHSAPLGSGPTERTAHTGFSITLIDVIVATLTSLDPHITN
jgi:hypothetical protein